MELVIFYNTERFNPQSRSSDDLITQESSVAYFNFDPTNRYKLASKVYRGQVIEERSLFQQDTTDFFSFEAGELVETSEGLDAYLTG